MTYVEGQKNLSSNKTGVDEMRRQIAKTLNRNDPSRVFGEVQPERLRTDRSPDPSDVNRSK